MKFKNVILYLIAIFVTFALVIITGLTIALLGSSWITVPIFIFAFIAFCMLAVIMLLIGDQAYREFGMLLHTWKNNARARDKERSRI